MDYHLGHLSLSLRSGTVHEIKRWVGDSCWPRVLEIICDLSATTSKYLQGYRVPLRYGKGLNTDILSDSSTLPPIIVTIIDTTNMNLSASTSLYRVPYHISYCEHCCAAVYNRDHPIDPELLMNIPIPSIINSKEAGRKKGCNECWT